MKFPEKYRSPHPLGFPQSPGDPFGWFMIPFEGKTFSVQADGQTDWEHVSVSMRTRCPTWPEMCFIKSLFWDEEETVVQYHPPKSDYVNFAKNCLHLWRFIGEMPRPPVVYVGPRTCLALTAAMNPPRLKAGHHVHFHLEGVS